MLYLLYDDKLFQDHVCEDEFKAVSRLATFVVCCLFFHPTFPLSYRCQFYMSNQFAFALRYISIVGAGFTSLIAGATTVHQFIGPDLTLPPPPKDLQERAIALGIEVETGASKSIS